MPHSKIWHIDVLDVCVDHWDCMWHQKSEVVIICQPSSILKFVPFRIQPSLSAMRELVHVQGGGMFHLMQWCCFVHVSCKPTFHAAKRYFHIISYHDISFHIISELSHYCLHDVFELLQSAEFRPYSSNNGSVGNGVFRWWKSCSTWDVGNP